MTNPAQSPESINQLEQELGQYRTRVHNNKILSRLIVVICFLSLMGQAVELVTDGFTPWVLLVPPLVFAGFFWFFGLDLFQKS